MSVIAEILGRLESAQADLEELLELIVVNENPAGLPTYKLAESICGKKVRYRLENLVVHLWAAKDYYQRDIAEEKGQAVADTFASDLLKHKQAHLVQYLANRIKHSNVTKLRKNTYFHAKPFIGTPFLLLTNMSAPGQMKPFFRASGDELPGFEIIGPQLSAPTGTATGFDTMRISAEIKTLNGRVVADTFAVCSEFADLLNSEHNQAKVKNAT